MEPSEHDTHKGHPMADCPLCVVKTPRTRSEKVAWAIASIAVVLLLLVLVVGVGSAPGNLLAFAAVPLLAVLVCPIVMGAMMWMMMRKGH
jgi:uncharacterized integral membrane protein